MSHPRMSLRTPAHPGRLALAVLAVLAVAAAVLPPTAQAQDVDQRVGDDADPVLAAIAVNQAKGEDPAARAVVGRSDVFADNLTATALVGADGVLLLTDGGPDAALRLEVHAELDRTLAPGDCSDPDAGPTVYLAGGAAAVSQAVEDTLEADRFCVQRLAGTSRVETAVALADVVPAPSGTVVLARADDWADAGSVGAWAAATSSRILVTDRDGLHPAAADALTRYAPKEIVLVGGTAALSQAVEDAAAQIAPVRRIQGPARDATAVAVADHLWDRSGGGVALADGYRDDAWAYLFTGAAYAASRQLPILYTNAGAPTPDTTAYLQEVPADTITGIGPDGRPVEPTPDLDGADVALQDVAGLAAPLMLKARPGSAELWVAERAGRVQAIGPAGTRQVLDIAGSVTTAGEGGLLGIAFDPDGTRLFTSSTNRAGDTVIDEFDITGDSVDVASRRELLQVDQPASNHNGGDLVWGPDGYLWWALGDGGGSDDVYENGQNPGTLLGSLVRIDVDGGDPYVIPPDNPFADGSGGAPELFAYGLRNPFRFTFDPATDDLYIADV
ncbi:MAG TPA: PQQ-dependent sugar dehydrogenase, partial [Euzebya sp.]|nr:PQQ-dependent sugar dehydrogenase [Euzebya sp.]